MNHDQGNQELLHLLNETLTKAIDVKNITDDEMNKLRRCFAEINDILGLAENHLQSATMPQQSLPNKKTLDSTTMPSENLPKVAHATEAKATSSPEEKKHFSDDIISLVEKIQKSPCPRKTQIVDSDLIRYVEDKNVSRCKGTIAFEGLWNGATGWKTVEELELIICYLWHTMPELFEAFDEWRAISEDKNQWNATYFDCQRNYLRHNFSIHRLCHMVLVYKYLRSKRSLKMQWEDEVDCRQETNPHSRPDFFEKDSAKKQPKSLRSHLLFVLGIIVAFILLAIIVKQYTGEKCYNEQELQYYMQGKMVEVAKNKCQKHLAHCKKCMDLKEKIQQKEKESPAAPESPKKNPDDLSSQKNDKDENKESEERMPTKRKDETGK